VTYVDKRTKMGHLGHKPLPGQTAGAPPTRWFDVLHTDPEPPRQLTLHELQRLTRLGFPNLALAIARGTCPDCGLNRAGTGHHQLCVEPQQERNPEPAPTKARQPWEPRPARRAA
jgi:hypothetical protein